MDTLPAASPADPDPETLLAQALERCAAEPIHHVGAIQGHGLLLAFDAAGILRMASDNLTTSFGRLLADCLGCPVSDLIGVPGVQAVMARLAEAPGRTVTLCLPAAGDVPGPGRSFSATAHESDGLILLELEEATDLLADDPEEALFQSARHSLWLFDLDTDLDTYCDNVAQEMHRMTGFDRVKIYRFDSKWNGEVIAERRNDRLPSLLGHHFPARDIPPQARALYEKNLVRVLADTESGTLPVLPALNPLNGQPLDLGRSAFRAISPVHIDYLRNMGVRSTITVSLLHDNRLWGLIACHSAGPRRVSHRQRELIEFVGKTISMKLSALGNAVRANSMEAVRQRLKRLTDLIRTSSNLSDIDTVISGFRDDYLSLAEATGSYIRLEHASYKIGRVPEAAQLDALVAWVAQQDLGAGIFATDALSKLYPPAAEFIDIASGMLVIPLDDRGKSFLFWFRSEVVRHIPWAGNPESEVSLDADGKPRIDPRRSFAVWLETTHGQAIPWANATIDAVKLFSFSVVQLLMRENQRRIDHADAANRAKSEFLANMSHEIRTPMNAIIGFTYLCLQSDLSPQNRDRLEKVHTSANGLLRILNDILDLSKIEAGRLVLEETAFDLNRVLDNVGNISAIQSQQKEVEFIVDVAPGCPVRLIGDPLRLEQILVNIAANAVKFTPAGDIVMSVRLLAEEGEEVLLRFDIADTGIGMTAGQREKLFQPFTQADGSTTRKYGGTGLGLSICKYLVEKMGGSIDVTSQPGQGAHFYFTVRLKRASGRNSAGIDPGEEIVLPPLQDLSVLLVDDNAKARAVTRQYLESFALRVQEAADGESALRLFEAAQAAGEAVDIVIADWEMPGMSGPETVRRLVTLASAGDRPKTMIISMHHHDYGATLSPFVDALLTKPFTASRLFNTLAGLLGHVVPKSAQHENTINTDRICGAHLLLVEDNDINQQVARQILERLGVRITLAENGAEAVARIAAESFDGVLMDIHMPVMDGYEATRRIRRNHSPEALPIIAMTANAMQGDRDKCLLCGMNDHIAKPVDPEEMFAVLARWVRPADGAAGHRSETPAPGEAAVYLPALPGFRTDEALHRLGGDMAAYLALLDRFRQRNAGVITQIRLAMMAGKAGEAERLAHTLKSTSGTLGAEGLQKKAAELEMRLRQGCDLPQIERLLASAEGELQSNLAIVDLALKGTVPSPAPAPAGNDGAPASLRDDLDAVQTLLTNFDTGAEDAVRRLLQQGGLAPAGEAALQTLLNLLEHYDYEQAAEKLQALLDSLPVAHRRE